MKKVFYTLRNITYVLATLFFAQFTYAQTQTVDIIIAGGGFSNEIGFEIVDNALNVQACTAPGSLNPGANTLTATLPILTPLEIYAFDSWGDGWNGYTLDVQISGVSILPAGPVTLATGGGISNACGTTLSASGELIGSFTVPEPGCEITCPASVVVDNDPGVCGADLTIAPAVTSNCSQSPVTLPVTTGTVPLLFDAAGTIDTDATLTGATTSIGDVTLDIAVTGDFGAPVEIFELQGPGGVVLFSQGGIGGGTDCNTVNLSVTVDQATWNGWAAGGSVTFTIIGDPDVDDICVSSDVVITANIVTGFESAINDFNGTSDASGIYEVGTTTVTFTALGDSGIPSTCSFDVTVNDTEGPVFTACPSDIVVDLDPGKCSEVINYSIEAEDNCGDFALSREFNLGDDWPVAVDNAIVCSNATPDEITYFRVFNLANIGVNVDNTLESIDLGVWRMDPGSEMNIDVYITNPSGPPNFGNMTLVGTATYVAPVLHNRETINMPVGIDLPAGVRIVVGARAIGTGTSGASVGMDTAGETNNTFVYGCSASLPGFFPDVTNLNQFFTWGMIMRANWTAPSVALEQVDNSGFTSGDEFPRGTFDQEWTATDLNGFVANCSFNVTVNEFANPTSTMACNDNVQVSLDASGVAVVGADMILEGGPYGCYDDYVVSIEGGGNTVGCDNVGQTLSVQVFDDNSSSSCWGNITVEDKIDPIIECSDFAVDCNFDLSTLVPGSVIAETASFNSGAQPAYDASSQDFTFDINAGPSSVVQNVGLGLDISHTWVQDLVVTIIAPDGTSVVAFGGQCGTADNVNADFDDSYANAFACSGGNPAIAGELRPQNAFAAFNGGVATGTWTVRVADNVGGDPTNINNINLRVAYEATFNGPSVTEACDFQVDVEEYTTSGDCSGDVGTVVRVYTVEDASGNSATCEQTITILRSSISDVVMPSSFDDLDLPSLDCSAGNSWDTNGNGYPDLDETGVPTLNGLPINNSDNCGFTAIQDGEDVVIDICPGTFKVRRKWIVTDWCTGEEIEQLQFIKVGDTDGPTLTCPAGPQVIEVTIPFGDPSTTTYNDCSGVVIIPAATVSGDNCSGVDASASVTELWNEDRTELLESIAGNGGSFSDVVLKDITQPNGNAKYTVVHKVQDLCGNVSECEYGIEVVDKVAPTAICDEITQVALNSFGLAEVFASDLDDGSYGNCGPIYFYAAEMGPNPFQTIFSESASVTFDCEDIGTTQNVVLLVSDVDIDAANLFDFNGEIRLSTVQANPLLDGRYNTCMIEVLVEDKLDPTCNAPADVELSCLDYTGANLEAIEDALAGDYDAINAIFGDAIVADNCSEPVASQTISGSLDNCGEGSFTRVWGSISDESGNTSNGACQQTISFSYDQNAEWAVVPAVVPAIIEVACTGDVDEYAPTVESDGCELIGVSSSDQVFTVVPDACFKVIRTWTLINWCDYDPALPAVSTLGLDGKYHASNGQWVEYSQVIKVQDNTAPVVTNEDETFEVDANCEAAFTIEGKSTEECDDVVSYVISSEDLEDYETNVNGSYVGVPEGIYQVTITAEDECGNIGAETITVTVLDAKAPTAYCTDELIVTIMPSGMGSIWAKDYDLGSTDNCTDELLITFSDSPEDFQDDSEMILEFNALDPDSEITCGSNALTVFFYDESMNQDYCLVSLIVDGVNCEGGDQPTVAGAIETEELNAVEGVMVEVNGGLFSESTDADGLFNFSLDAGGDYTIVPNLDANASNGVTTFDIVLITKHILGVETLDSAYKQIAADANNSCSITTLDVVAIRKVILQIDSNFPNNTSWRFADKAHNFNANPSICSFPEVVSFNNLDLDQLATDFVAIKVGDVNGSAVTNSFQTSEDRTFNGAFSLEVEDIAMKAGKTYNVAFTANQAIEGMQFTMNFDAASVAFEGLVEGVAKEDNFGFALLDKGAITASWNAADLYTFQGEEVFTLSLTAMTDVQLSDVLSINSRYTAAEAYSAEGLQDVALNFAGQQGITYSLYQNTPNPFKGATMIGFELPSAATAIITIKDMNGNVVRVIEGDYAKGYNSVSVEGLSTSGVMYYTLESGDFTATKKMIIVE